MSKDKWTLQQLFDGKVLLKGLAEAFDSFKNMAKDYFENSDKRDALLEMMRILADKIMLDDDHKLRSVVDDILTLIRLIKAYFKKEYRDISTTDIVLILGGLIYVITPLDFIPDIGPVGFIDDLAIINMLVRQLSAQIAQFRKWEIEQGEIIDIEILEN